MGLIKKTYKNIKDFLIKYCTAFYKMFLELIQKINCFLISFFSKHIAPYLQKFSIQISQMKCSEVREETNSLKKEIKSNRTRIWMSRILHTYLFIYIYIFIILFHKEPSILDYTQAICCLYLSFSSFYIWYRTIRVILNFKSNGLTKILRIALETFELFLGCVILFCALFSFLSTTCLLCASYLKYDLLTHLIWVYYGYETFSQVAHALIEAIKNKF